MQEAISLWPLIGIAVIVVGFVLRFNPVLVVIISGIVTGVAAHMPIATILEKLGEVVVYPRTSDAEKVERAKQNEPDINDWYHITLHQLVAVCRDVSSKYTRSKVRKSLPCDFSYIIQELLHEHTEDHDKTAYVNVIVDTIISTGRADDFIIAIANVIQRLAIDQLHILGDIYDRGPGAHIILDKMRRYHSWDIQWGNHDVLWMGAAAGNAYSMIPVDNATGNFVKVEQRVPVRIALTPDNDPKQVALLRAGLNVETKVRLK